LEEGTTAGAELLETGAGLATGAGAALRAALGAALEEEVFTGFGAKLEEEALALEEETAGALAVSLATVSEAGAGGGGAATGGAGRTVGGGGGRGEGIFSSLSQAAKVRRDAERARRMNLVFTVVLLEVISEDKSS
jgi:hypothetical protein